MTRPVIETVSSAEEHRRNSSGNGGNPLRNISTGDWLKIFTLIISFFILITQIQGEIKTMKDEQKEMRATVRELQKDIESIKINQAEQNVLLRRIADK